MRQSAGTEHGSLSTDKDSIHVSHHGAYTVLTVISKRGSVKATVMMNRAEAEALANMLTGRR